MENLHSEGQPQADVEARLQELTELAAEEFGRDALFTYLGADNAYVTMTFNEAIQVCGRHIATAPNEMVLGMLREMATRAQKFTALVEQHPEAQERYNQSLERGRAALAKHALSETEQE